MDFLKNFSDRGILVVILSMSIQPILDVIEQRLGFSAQCIGNKVLLDEENHRFDRNADNRMISGQDKLERLKQITQIYNVKTPLVIGHSHNELPLVHYARCQGGISIGINPQKETQDEFDILLRGLSWGKLLNKNMGFC